MAYFAYAEVLHREDLQHRAVIFFREKWPVLKNTPAILLCEQVRPFKLVGQSLSAFCTSSLENVSAVCSSHSLSETVLLLSLTLFGLVSSEHSGTSLIFGFGSVSDSDPMDAFYSDIAYYTRNGKRLSRVFFILGKFFSNFTPKRFIIIQYI